jgi:nucleoside-diphosphate-sugar epimerase
MAEISSYQHSIVQVGVLPLPWMELNGKNILVTGASGLIGGCLIEVLLSRQQDYQIYAAARDKHHLEQRFSSYVDDKRLHLVQYDVRNPLNCMIDFHYIIHAASNASPNFFVEDPVGVMQSNLAGVTHLLDYGKAHGMKRFLYISTGEVYGNGDKDKWREEDSGYVNSMLVRSCYPSSKRASETLCVAYSLQYHLDVVVARLCHTYGPIFGKQDNRVYAQFINNVLSGENIILKSAGEQYRSWIYVIDCISALLYILLKGENCNAYNVANEESNVTIKTLAKTVAQMAGRQVVFDIPTPVEKQCSFVIKKAVFDTSKLCQLGWKPKFALEQGLKETIDYLKTRH